MFLASVLLADPRLALVLAENGRAVRLRWQIGMGPLLPPLAQHNRPFLNDLCARFSRTCNREIRRRTARSKQSRAPYRRRVHQELSPPRRAVRAERGWSEARRCVEL